MSIEYFPGQKPDEEIKAIVRPHWMNLLGAILATLLAAVLPIIIIVAGTALEGPSLEGTTRAIVAAMLGIYYLALATYFFVRWLAVYLDVGVITDQRVVDVDQRSLFNRNVAELDSKMVQDISSDKSGFLQTIFDFGDVVIQTAGERPNFTLEGAPHPERVVDLIQHSVGERNDKESQSSEETAEAMQEAAKEMKEAADALKDQTPEQTEATPSQPASPAQPDAPTPPTDEPTDLPRDYQK